jgi:RNA polymerase sigma factor (TIGR02999 family)
MTEESLTQLIAAAGDGNQAARTRVFELAYQELKRIARGTLRRSGASAPINPTTLVHEAYLKIARGDLADLNGSVHFYSLFARAMRQVVVDLGRQLLSARHGGGLQRIDLDENHAETDHSLGKLLQIDHALESLASADAELAELVEWHFFAGLSFVEIARIRGVNERTVRRHWDLARSYLLDAMPEGVG